MVKITKIKIAQDDGTSTWVDTIAVYGCLALHLPTDRADRIVITHMPTGHAIMRISNSVPHEAIAPFLLKLSEALANVRGVLSINTDVGKACLPWIDLIRATERAFKMLAVSKPYTPIAINRPKVQRVYQRPANMPLPIPNMVSITAQVAA